MPLIRLDHVNIRTSRLSAMIHWYSNVLGMEQGDRPDFPFNGAWMYVGGKPVVHLIEVDGDAGAGSENSLKLEHFALTASDWQLFESALVSAGVNYSTSVVSSFNILQCNIHDPDGNHIHIDFPADESQ